VLIFLGSVGLLHPLLTFVLLLLLLILPLQTTALTINVTDPMKLWGKNIPKRKRNGQKCKKFKITDENWT
jgi:hypothetical protein